MFRRKFFLIASVLLPWLVAGTIHAQEVGVFEDRVVFGQSAALTGPAQEIGLGMQLGIEAAFAEINRRGGVHGRMLQLISLDDSYEPVKAIANTNELIDVRKVFALIGAVGTPTSRSAVPVAAAAGVPYMAPFTGAAFLREDEWTNVINLRASYFQETEEIIDYLHSDLGISRVGVLFQDDSFGQAGYRGVVAALARRDLEIVASGFYPRNTTAVKTALLSLRSRAPEAIVLVGAYQPVATFINWARHLDFEPIFATISFVGSNALIRETGENSTGVIVTQVVPHPNAFQSDLVWNYRRALTDYQKDAVPGFVTIEGYLAGRLAIEFLKNCGRELTRTCFLDNMNSDEIINLGGFRIHFGGDNQGSDHVLLTRIDRRGSYRTIRR